MAKMLIATGNRGKTKEIINLLQQDFPGLKIYSLTDVNIAEECPEEGRTFLENATAKSLFYSNLAAGYYTIADDSGLQVEALHGEPGIQSARYAGVECEDERNIEKLLNNLKDQKNRAARFVTEVVLSYNGSLIVSFRGEAEGLILSEKRGSSGFGYDPVFYYPSLGKTFAQLTIEEKNLISHRAAALQKLKNFLKNGSVDLS